MSTGHWNNNFRRTPFGNAFLCDRTFHYVTSRQTREIREKEIERTPIQVDMRTILVGIMNDASAVNRKLYEFETETDGPDTHN